MLHFQGVQGAYSESAAHKAYPNCEAVPCEQFETTFDVKYCYPFLLIRYLFVMFLCWFPLFSSWNSS